MKKFTVLLALLALVGCDLPSSPDEDLGAYLEGHEFVSQRDGSIFTFEAGGKFSYRPLVGFTRRGTWEIHPGDLVYVSGYEDVGFTPLRVEMRGSLCARFKVTRFYPGFDLGYYTRRDS